MTHPLLGRTVHVALDVTGVVVTGMDAGGEERLSVRIQREDGTATVVTVPSQYLEETQ